MDKKRSYEILTQELQGFISNTLKVLSDIQAGKENPDEHLLNELAQNIQNLNEHSHQVLHDEVDDMRLEIQLIQNVIQQPVFFRNSENSHKKVSILHAAKRHFEDKNDDEFKQVLKECSKHPEDTTTLIQNLHAISTSINEHLRRMSA